MNKFFSLKRYPQGWLAILLVISGFSFLPATGQLLSLPLRKTHQGIQSPPLLKFPRAEDTLHIELINAIGGVPETIKIAEDYAYFGQGNTLVTLDVSDPGHPIRCSKIVLPGIVRDIKVAEGLVYVANDNWGVQILDINNPTEPVILSNIDTPGQARAIYVQGEMIFVADGHEGLQIIDNSRPGEQKLIGGFPNIVGIATDVQVDGNYAYLLHGDTYYSRYSSSITKFDVSNPDNLSELDSYPVGAAYKMFITGGLAYIPSLYYTGLEIIDLATMSPLGAYPGYNFYNIQVHEGLAFVSQVYKLLILDVHDPRNPALLKTTGVSGVIVDLDVVENKVFNLSSSDKDRTRVEMIDLTDWEHPKYIHSYTADPTYHHTWEIQSNNGLVYAVSGTGGETCHLYAINIRNVNGPQLIADYAELSEAWDLKVLDNYAYIAAGYGGLKIIDVSDPQKPTLVGTYPGVVGELDVVANLAFIVNGGLLEVIDVSNPLNPKLVGSFADISLLNYVGAIKIQKGLAYLSAFYNSQWGLYIFDIRNPGMINLIGSYLTDFEIRDVEIEDDLAFISINKGYEANGSIKILDISAPAYPTLKGEINTTGIPYDIEVHGNNLYSAVTSEGLLIYDISFPSMPKLDGIFQTPGNATISLDVSDHWVTIHEYSSGLQILWIAHPESILVTSDGGSLTSELDRVTYTFSPGTFMDTVKITHIAKYLGNKFPIGDLVGIAPLFEVTATISPTNQGLQPEQPFTIHLEYSEADLGTVIEETLAVYFWNGSQWVLEPSSIVDLTNNTISAKLDHFGLWTVLGETHRSFLPFLNKNAGVKSGY